MFKTLLRYFYIAHTVPTDIYIYKEDAGGSDSHRVTVPSTCDRIVCAEEEKEVCIYERPGGGGTAQDASWNGWKSPLSGGPVLKIESPFIKSSVIKIKQNTFLL